MERHGAPKTWYTLSDTFHHNNASCRLGGKITATDRFSGDGRRRLCPECKEMNDATPSAAQILVFTPSPARPSDRI